MRDVSRRGVLGTVAAVAGGVGLSGADALAAAAASPAAATPASASVGPAAAAGGGPVPEVFSVHATALRAHGAERARSVGDHHLVTGGLTHPTGADAGEFFGHVTVAGRHDLVATASRTLESHVFDLTDGTLTGSGTVGADGTGRFAVTGGTGAFHAARGSYTVHRDPGTSAAGAAAFTFSLTSREVDHRGR